VITGPQQQKGQVMADTSSFRFSPDSPDAARSTPRGESLIDRESHFTGTYRTPHDLRIEGRYEGEIECQGTVFVGETASINARIVAGNVTVAGQLEGEIVCDARFEILRTGRVAGSVSSGVTVVHEGAFYQGELRMTRPGSDRSRREPPPAPLIRAELPPMRPPVSADSAMPARASLHTPERTPPPSPRRRPAEPPAPDSGEPEMPASLTATSAGPHGLAGGNGNGRPTPPNGGPLTPR
jgi:cytoskeletal protein CcmA (bactofilin family)